MQLSGLTREAEQRSQAAMITRLMQKTQRQIAREIARAMTVAGRNVSKGEPMAASMMMHDHKAAMTKVLTALWQAAAKQAARRFVNMFKARPEFDTKADSDDLPDADEIDRIIRDWVRSNGGEAIEQITQATRNDIVRIISAGVADGLSNADIGSLILQAAPTKSASRAQTIARTEVHRASQSVSLEMGLLALTPMVKVWLSAGDDRTRGNDSSKSTWDHAGADGQQRAPDQPFEISHDDGRTELLDYPGDPSGSAGNVINCRCVLGWELR